TSWRPETPAAHRPWTWFGGGYCSSGRLERPAPGIQPTRPLFMVVCFRRKHEIERRAPERFCVFHALERGNQRLLYAEHGVGLNVVVIAVECVRDQFLKAGRGNQ